MRRQRLVQPHFFFDVVEEVAHARRSFGVGLLANRLGTEIRPAIGFRKLRELLAVGPDQPVRGPDTDKRQQHRTTEIPICAGAGEQLRVAPADDLGVVFQVGQAHPNLRGRIRPVLRIETQPRAEAAPRRRRARILGPGRRMLALLVRATAVQACRHLKYTELVERRRGIPVPRSAVGGIVPPRCLVPAERHQQGRRNLGRVDGTPLFE